METLAKRVALHRLRILETAVKAKKGHIAPAFSCLDVLASLYDGKTLSVRPKEPRWVDRDRFILSKGHGCLALYTVLAEQGFFDAKELEKFGSGGHFLAGHPDREIPGVEAATGSLGHGLGIGVGFALSGKLTQSAWKTVVVLGDAECQEGSVWEAALFAAQHRLSRLWAIVDCNALGATDFTESMVGVEPFADKWRSFGWEARECNGHDFDAIRAAITEMEASRSDRPKALLARTIKGKGVSFMEASPAWHHKVPSGEDLERALKELKKGVDATR